VNVGRVLRSEYSALEADAHDALLHEDLRVIMRDLLPALRAFLWGDPPYDTLRSMFDEEPAE